MSIHALRVSDTCFGLIEMMTLTTATHHTPNTSKRASPQKVFPRARIQGVHGVRDHHSGYFFFSWDKITGTPFIRIAQHHDNGPLQKLLNWSLSQGTTEGYWRSFSEFSLMSWLILGFYLQSGLTCNVHARSVVLSKCKKVWPVSQLLAPPAIKTTYQQQKCTSTLENKLQHFFLD